MLLLTTASSPAQPRLGAIRGRVEINRVVTPAERRPSASDLGTPPPREIPDLRRAVVYLETAPAAALESREPVRARMDQRNETFLPHVLTIDAGTLVDFPNNDTTYHNVFSLSKTKKFDLGRYARGKSKSIRFDRPGVVRIFCDIHSHMSAFVLVFSHPYYAKAEVDGRYRIDNVPPGTYTVSAWHEGEARETKTVTVPPQGGDVDLDFVVQ
jgi:plastocyanin